SQDISPEDIDRMNSEKEILAKNLESIIAAKEEASKMFWERELLAQKQLDVVEKQVIEYAQAVERINKGLMESCGLDYQALGIALRPSPGVSPSGGGGPIVDKSVEHEIMVLIICPLGGGRC